MTWCRAFRAGLLLAAVVLLQVVAFPRHPQPGYAQDYTPVSTVNGDEIPREIFHQRVRLVRWQYLRELEKLHEVTGGNFALTPGYVANLVFDLRNPTVLADSVLGEMERERLLWQTGEALGLVPTLEDAQAVERAFFSNWTGVPVERIATDPAAQDFIQQWYAAATAISGMTENDIRILFETEALRDRLYVHLAENVPQEELAVHTRHILCGYPRDGAGNPLPPSDADRAAAADCADEVLDRLVHGDSFDELAAIFSDDPGSAAEGGDVGWSLISYLVEGYAEAVRDADLNTIIGPVETIFGLHIIEVLERETRSLSEEQYAGAVAGYYDLWLQTLINDATITRSANWDANVPADPALDTASEAVLQAIAQFEAESP